MQTIEIKKYYNNEIMKMEVVDKDTLEDYILYDLNRDEVIYNAYQEAKINGGYEGVVEVYINAETLEMEVVHGKRYGFNLGYFQSNDYKDICIFTLYYRGYESLESDGAFDDFREDIIAQINHLYSHAVKK